MHFRVWRKKLMLVQPISVKGKRDVIIDTVKDCIKPHKRILKQSSFCKREIILPDLVVESASPKLESKSTFILTESIMTVCSFKLLAMNSIAAFRSLSGKPVDP